MEVLCVQHNLCVYLGILLAFIANHFVCVYMNLIIHSHYFSENVVCHTEFFPRRTKKKKYSDIKSTRWQKFHFSSEVVKEELRFKLFAYLSNECLCSLKVLYAQKTNHIIKQMLEIVRIDSGLCWWGYARRRVFQHLECGVWNLISIYSSTNSSSILSTLCSLFYKKTSPDSIEAIIIMTSDHIFPIILGQWKSKSFNEFNPFAMQRNLIHTNPIWHESTIVHVLGDECVSTCPTLTSLSMYDMCAT